MDARPFVPTTSSASRQDTHGVRFVGLVATSAEAYLLIDPEDAAHLKHAAHRRRAAQGDPGAFADLSLSASKSSLRISWRLRRFDS